MLVAVPHAHGRQAAAIARTLEAAGHQVRRLSRKAAPGVHVVDPESEDELARALEGVDGLAFTVPQDYRPGVRQAYAERVVRAAERAGVGRLAVNMAGPVHPTDARPVSRDLRAVRSILQGGGVPAVVLQPTAFLDNLAEPWAVPPIVNEGVLAYPAPAAAAVSWLSHDSLGAFVRAAMERPVAGRVFEVGGPEAITGPQLASVIGAAAGRPVRYQELPLEAFAASLNAAFGPPAGDHIADLYRLLRADPQIMARDPAGWAELEARPETAEAWAARQRWRSAA